MAAGTERSSSASTWSRRICRLEDPRTLVTDGWGFRRLSNERNHMFVSFADVVCDGMTAVPAARRPSPGAVPGRWGGLLGGKDPTGRHCFADVGRLFKPSYV